MAEWKWQLWLSGLISLLLLATVVNSAIKGAKIGHRYLWPLIFLLPVSFLQTVTLPNALWKSVSLTASFEDQVEKISDQFLSRKVILGGETTPDTRLPEAANTISIHPERTRASMCVLGLGIAMLIVAQSSFRDRISVMGLFGSLGASGLAISLLGLYQSVSRSEWTLLPHMLPESFATFISRNSAPQFLASALAGMFGLSLLYARRINSKDRRYQIKYPSVNLFAKVRRRIDDFFAEADLTSFLFLSGVTTIAAAVLATNSRGGILACICAISLTAVSVLNQRRLFLTFVFSCFILVFGCIGLLSILDLDQGISSRLETMSAEAYRLDNERFMLWKMILNQPTCWRFGSGLGTFHFAILPFYDPAADVWFLHAENIYLELLSNHGIVSLVVVLVGIGILLRSLLFTESRGSLARTTRIACLFGMSSVLMHGLVDFSLVLPAVFLPLTCLVGAYLGCCNSNETGRKSKSHNDRRRANSVSSRVSQSKPFPEYRSERRSHSNTRIRSKMEIGGYCQAGIVLAAICIGFPDLQGFAAGERLSDFDVTEGVPANSSLTIDIDDAFNRRSGETEFQLGRIRQAFAVQSIQKQFDWPAEPSIETRTNLSQPELFGVAFRGIERGEFGWLKDRIEGVSGATDSLRQSFSNMQRALQACPMDWRANWGMLRSEIGSLSDSDLNNLYARISITCRNKPGVMQAAGTHALLSGHKNAGLHLWSQILPVSRFARSKIAGLAPDYIDENELLSILPSEPWACLDIANQFNSREKQELVILVIRSVDFDELMSDEDIGFKQWFLIAWAADKVDKVEFRRKALYRAILADPRNEKAVVLYADALFNCGDIEQCRLELRKGLSLNPESKIIRDKLDHYSAKKSVTKD